MTVKCQVQERPLATAGPSWEKINRVQDHNEAERSVALKTPPPLLSPRLCNVTRTSLRVAKLLRNMCQTQSLEDMLMDSEEARSPLGRPWPRLSSS